MSFISRYKTNSSSNRQGFLQEKSMSVDLTKTQSLMKPNMSMDMNKIDINDDEDDDAVSLDTDNKNNKFKLSTNNNESENLQLDEEEEEEGEEDKNELNRPNITNVSCVRNIENSIDNENEIKIRNELIKLENNFKNCDLSDITNNKSNTNKTNDEKDKNFINYEVKANDIINNKLIKKANNNNNDFEVEAEEESKSRLIKSRFDKETNELDEKQNLIQSTTNVLNSSSNERKLSITNTNMKKNEKKRQSKSASTLLRRLFTCGGVVSSCSGFNNNRSSTNSRKSSKSPNRELLNQNSNFNQSMPEVLINDNTQNDNCNNNNILINSKNNSISQSNPCKINDDDNNNKNNNNSLILNPSDIINNNNKKNDISISTSIPNITVTNTESITPVNMALPKIVLPILKINDDLVPNINNNEEYTIEDDNLDAESVDEDENENEMIEDEENYEQEDEDQMPEDEDELVVEDDYVEDDEEEEEEDESKLMHREEDEDYDGAYHNNDHNIIVEETDDADIDDNQVFEEEEYSPTRKDHVTNVENSLNATEVPSLTFDLQSEDPDKSGSTTNLNKSDDNSNDNSGSEKLLKSKPKITDCYSKFLTANNILTDRGCIVNIRTGSFNLGCQQSAISSTSLGQDSLNNKYLNDEELIDSSEFFNSLQQNDHHNEFIKNSMSNYSFRNSMNSSFNSSIDNYNTSNYYNVPLLLVQNRRKNSNTNINNDSSKKFTNPVITTDSNDNLFEKKSNLFSGVNLPNSSTEYTIQNPSKLNTSNTKGFLTVNNQSSIQASASVNNNLLHVASSLSPSSEQDQIRRCSHDPNIEKLHKNYINNVKLASAPVCSSVSVSTTNTDSIPNISSPPPTNINSFSSSIRSIPKFNKKSTYLENFKTSKSNDQNFSIDSTDKTLNLNQSDYETKSDDKIEIESEKSDVLNEIFKVDKWLRDNKNHQNILSNNKKELINYPKRLNKLPSMTISEDEDNFNSLSSLNNKNCYNETNNNNNNTNNNQLNSNLNNRNSNSYYEDENDENDTNSNDAKTKYSYETNDSAIDIRSYGSISTLSKASSNKSRVHWQSFTKYYHYYFFQSMNTTWSKYQISAMSLEQLMALRKLALIQFSKLVERQHSTMIRTFRIFSKKNAANEFQRVYDSIDSLNTPKLDSNKTKQHTSIKDKDSENLNLTCIINSPSNQLINSKESNALINNKKASYQLGAQLGTSGDKKKRSRSSIKQLEVLINSDKNESQHSTISADENSSTMTSQNQNEQMKNSFNCAANQDNLVISNEKSSIKATIKPNAIAVFGVSLSVIMQQSGQPLPQHILESMKFIREIAPNEIGVFRKNGNKARINKLKESIDKNETINFLSPDITVFDVADTLKLYFRELPECLITNKLSDILLTNYTKIRPEERKIILQQVMLLVPDENRLVLQTLLMFLNDIAKHHKTNQMTRSNLAVCFSPVIFCLNFDNKKKSKTHKLLTGSGIAPVNMHKMAPSLIYPVTNQMSTSDLIEPVLSLSQEKLNSKSSEYKDKNTLLPQLENSQSELRKSSTSSNDLKSKASTPQQQGKLLSVPSSSLNQFSSSNSNLNSNSSSSSSPGSNSNFLNPQASKQNSKRKYSDKFNKAASSIVNFGVELSTAKSSAFFSDSIKENLENLEYMNKVVQLCVSDMIKYSMDLFTVPVENFEKLKLSVSYGSEPYNLDYFYDVEAKKLKRLEFFTNNINIDKTYWFYFDKYEDVSIYYFKNDYQAQSLISNLNQTQSSVTLSNSNINLLPTSAISSLTTTAVNSGATSATVALQISTQTSSNVTSITTNSSLSSSSVPSSLLIPQKNESFNDKLKLWKCCTLIKHQNINLEKILNRIKNERQLWDDDFRDGKVVETLDEKTDIVRYVVSFMPPHPSRDFFEMSHYSFQQSENETLILTNTSVKHQSGNKLIGDIRSNLIISKYVVEKLIATDTTTTFKITHYVKLDYKGFTLEFYNKTFGYMMARLLYNLKLSLLNTA